MLRRLLKRGELVERNGVPGNLFASGFRPTTANSMSNGIVGLEEVEAFTFTPYVQRHQRMFFELLGRLPSSAIRPRGVVDALPYAPTAPAPTAIEATPIDFSTLADVS